MKKDYDLAKVENELKGASAFFKPAAAPSESPAINETPPPVSKTSSYPVAEERILMPDDWQTSEATPSQDEPAVTTSRRHDSTPSPTGLDINQETASHDTLRLAVNETKELEGLKSALKWDHDLSVSKNDICRVALHALLEDYRTKGATSDAVKRLRKKQGRRQVLTS